MLHFELVPNDSAVDSKLYCRQLGRVYEKLVEKYQTIIRRKRALFQQDSDRPHKAKKTKEKFDELEEAEVPPHPHDSPGSAPSDYGLIQFEAERMVLQSNPDACRSVAKDC